MITFDQLVWQHVQNLRPTSIVLDKLHARAIIQDRVDALRSDKTDALTTLAEIAAAAQICAEQLLLIRQQELTREPSELEKKLQFIVQYILQHSTTTQSKQRGVPRHTCELNADFLEQLQDIV